MPKTNAQASRLVWVKNVRGYVCPRIRLLSQGHAEVKMCIRLFFFRDFILMCARV